MYFVFPSILLYICAQGQLPKPNDTEIVDYAIEYNNRICEAMIEVMILYHLVASSLPAGRPRSTCRLHPCACQAWLGPRPACRMMWTNRGRCIEPASHLVGRHLADRTSDNRGFVLRERLVRSWCPHQ